MRSAVNKRNLLRFISYWSLGVILPSASESNSKENKDNIVKRKKSMKFTLHKSQSRGFADHGWLKSHHTFSFASYHNPDRMGFGALRVINDDIVAPSKGFGTHPHENMEIISVPLSGSLMHKDTMGNRHVIKKGEVQAMTAGSGLSHSEYNNSAEDMVNFLQIWVMPKKLGVEPSYSQKEFLESKRENSLQLVVSPDGRQDSVAINQDAYFSLAKMDLDSKLVYKKYEKTNGVYFFVLDGKLDVSGQSLHERDGLGVLDGDEMEIKAQNTSEVLIMEVPMEIERRA